MPRLGGFDSFASSNEPRETGQAPSLPVFHFLTSAYEMHDLETVALMKSYLVPAVARGDLAVQFDRDSVCFEP
jgi:hypothetical protein